MIARLVRPWRRCKRSRKCLVGGIGHDTTLVHGTLADVDAQVQDAWKQLNRRGLILGPGCVASLESPEASILQLRKRVERTASAQMRPIEWAISRRCAFLPQASCPYCPTWGVAPSFAGA
jgi:hypothetical protein